MRTENILSKLISFEFWGYQTAACYYYTFLFLDKVEEAIFKHDHRKLAK